MPMRNHSVHQELLENDYQYRKLFTEHEKLEQSLDQMRNAPAVESDKIHSLKRHKLHLREQMSQIEQRAHMH